MAISREQVRHVARLARLALTDDDVDRFREQLSAILDAVGKVGELDLSAVEPTSHPLDLVNVLGKDEPHPSLALDDVLANAPDPEDGFFGVPARTG
jgi:aspartyl-tRNA(Asn)/glutamyl-tRNA(Gln) amidotransferase subunit C